MSVLLSTSRMDDRCLQAILTLMQKSSPGIPLFMSTFQRVSRNFSTPCGHQWCQNASLWPVEMCLATAFPHWPEEICAKGDMHQRLEMYLVSHSALTGSRALRPPHQRTSKPHQHARALLWQLDLTSQMFRIGWHTSAFSANPCFLR